MFCGTRKTASRVYRRSYSSRSATTGCTRMARRTGTHVAAALTSTKSSAVPAKLAGSLGAQAGDEEHRQRLRDQRGDPQSHDHADGDENRGVARHEARDRRRVAPSAMRMPISRVRRVTV